MIYEPVGDLQDKEHLSFFKISIVSVTQYNNSTSWMRISIIKRLKNWFCTISRRSVWTIYHSQFLMLSQIVIFVNNSILGTKYLCTTHTKEQKKLRVTTCMSAKMGLKFEAAHYQLNAHTHFKRCHI